MHALQVVGETKINDMTVKQVLSLIDGVFEGPRNQMRGLSAIAREVGAAEFVVSAFLLAYPEKYRRSNLTPAGMALWVRKDSPKSPSWIPAFVTRLIQRGKARELAQRRAQLDTLIQLKPSEVDLLIALAMYGPTSDAELAIKSGSAGEDLEPELLDLVKKGLVATYGFLLQKGADTHFVDIYEVASGFKSLFSTYT